MSQKDYILVAAALRKGAERAVELGPAEIAMSDYMITQVANDLQAAHKGYGFKRSVFMSAAGHSDPLRA